MNVFGLAKIKKLENYKMSSNLQYNFLDNNNPGIISPDCLQQLGISKIENSSSKYDCYDCVYDKKRNRKGHIDGLQFDYYFERKNFSAYGLDNLLYINIRTDDFTTFINDLNKNSSGSCELEIIDINFDNIELKTENVQSIVVSGIKSASIKAKALYGYKLSDNQEYQELKEQGNISSLTVEYVKDGNKYNVLISKKGSIYVMNSGVNEEESLSIVSDVYKNLLL